MNYISDKEPLIYLFLINCDFIEDDGKILGNSPAGVAYKDKRVLFYYSPDKISEFTKEELYYLIIHEAFHILKKHHVRHRELFKKNMLIANMAEDAAINHEINSMNFTYDLKTKMPKGGITPPENFLKSFSQIGEDAIETFRIFSWMLKEAEKNRQLSLENFEEVYNKKTGERGKITLNNGNGTFQVKKENDEEKTMNGEDLIPIIKPSKSGSFLPYDGEAYYEISFDAHLEKENDEEDNFESLKNEIERQNFADNIIEQAIKIEEKIKSKHPGKEIGNLTRKIKELNKPKVNWRKQLKKNMNTFISNNSYLKDKVQSPVNYPYDPKSNYGILGKHTIEIVHKITSYIIFAIDTSGSCFSSEQEMEIFFTELDFAAKELQFSRTGKILTLQWDWEIRQGLKEYKRNSWKNFNIKGGGGTNPSSIFNYLSRKAEPRGNGYLFNYEGTRFITKNKKDLPYLVILTDGYFFPVRENDLGIYKENPKNILWITRNKRNIFPKENFIQYS
jgi:predicted metal-dependent peptidase